MPGDPALVHIPQSLLHEVYREARRVFPAECCGWLVGAIGGDSVESMRSCDNAQSVEAHADTMDRGSDTAYVIAGADLLELNRELEGQRPPKIIFHSHPNGRAYFSETDHRVATSPWGDGPMYPVLQLVVGITKSKVVEAVLFGWSDVDNGFIEMTRFPGADV